MKFLAKYLEPRCFLLNVTKTFLPNKDEFIPYLNQIWDTHCLTGIGPLMKELEDKLLIYLGAKYLVSVANGTLAMQLSIKGLPLTGEVITTPVTFIASASSLVWENVMPVFVDVEPDTWLIDPKEIEKKITNKTTGILGVHAFGNVCNVGEIDRIAKDYNLKVFYDAAHCFGVEHQGNPVCNYGDASAISFNATKLFHTVEGGAIITQNENLASFVEYSRRFGFADDTSFHGLGINAKLSELHAAVGLSMLPHVSDIIQHRKKIVNQYDDILNDRLQTPFYDPSIKRNYAYYPVLFKDEHELQKVFDALKTQQIYPRRYFYPALNLLPYLNPASCPIAEDLSSRMACLPLSAYSTQEETQKVCEIILDNL